MSSVTVEVVYRGIFQKNLGQRIGRGIVLAARKEGKVGISPLRALELQETAGNILTEVRIIPQTHKFIDLI